ncbi:exonuclease DPD1, chloroplastic/mitochondrial-like isoform X2 [Zingiber officinale]|uniref:exonuclease DPD1, chloroplastic/mitochondrial-like isoform X2 n=1 Tax=Zingiber officinale TaxID=94328 RepID=UPI001C4AAE7D|nr:exonuclease DPD1, chloroplastic/mitochondrial-like isoform X2 [Zingiber officinale]
MSLFCPGNFHHLRSNLGCTSTINYLALRYISPKQFPARIYNLRNSAQVNEARSEPHSSSATCNNPLLHLRDGLVDVGARSNETTRLKSRKLSTIGATPRKTQIPRVGISTKKDKKQPELCGAKVVNCYDSEPGLSRENERIIEFAVRDLNGGKNSSFETLINPEKKDVTNTYIHGIRDDMVNNPNVPTFRELLPILLRYVRSRQMPGKPVLWVAHSGRRFDVPFLVKEFQRCSMTIPEDWMFLDSLALARQLVLANGCKLPSASLSALREHYGIPLTGPAHRAMQDVTVLCYVFQRITFDLKLTVPQLLDKAFRP